MTDNKLITKVKNWKEAHPDLYEFILFNIMSNVATVTNFVVLWVSSGLFSKIISNRSFHWFIFNYSKNDGGLSAFLSFLLAYVCAQIVNFIVQRKIVFGANNQIGKALPWYILTVTVAGIISIWLPPYVISLLKPYIHGFAPTVANVLNIIIQVVINYPMMKFVIMKPEKK